MKDLGYANLLVSKSFLIPTLWFGCILASGCAANISSSVTQYEDGVRKQLAALEVVEDLVAESYAFSFKRDVILTNKNFGGENEYPIGFWLIKCNANNLEEKEETEHSDKRTEDTTSKGTVLYKDLSECKLAPVVDPEKKSDYATLRLWSGPVDFRVRALLREYAANMSALYRADTAAQLNDALRTANYSTRSMIAVTERDEQKRAQALNEVDAVTSMVNTIFSTAMRGDKNASIAEMTSHSFLLSEQADYDQTVGQLDCPLYLPNKNNYEPDVKYQYKKDPQSNFYYRHSVGCAGSLYKTRLILNLLELAKISSDMTSRLKSRFNELVDLNKYNRDSDNISYRQDRIYAVNILDSLRFSQRLNFESWVMVRRLKEDIVPNLDDDDDIRAIQEALAFPTDSSGKVANAPPEAKSAVNRFLSNENDPRWYLQVDFQTASDCLHVLASTNDVAKQAESAFCIGRFSEDSNLLFEQAVNLESSFRGISLTGH